MSYIKKQLGKNIKYYRNVRGLTQEELAENINITARSLSFIECGINFVTADTLEKICDVLSVSPKQLFNFNSDYNSKNDVKKEIELLIKNNPEKINDVYKILKGFWISII